MGRASWIHPKGPETHFVQNTFSMERLGLSRCSLHPWSFSPSSSSDSRYHHHPSINTLDFKAGSYMRQVMQSCRQYLLQMAHLPIPASKNETLLLFLCHWPSSIPKFWWRTWKTRRLAHLYWQPLLWVYILPYRRGVIYAYKIVIIK